MSEDTKVQGDEKTPEQEEVKTSEEPQTFTTEQVDAAVNKAKNDTLADYKRLETEFRRSQSVAEGAIKRLKEIEEASYRREEEAVKDDPEKLTEIRQRRRDVQRKAELDEREAKINEGLAKVVQVTAGALAEKYNVSKETLIEYAADDAEKMEKLAQSYGERKVGESEAKKVRMTKEPDGGKTTGGGSLSKEDIANMSPKERSNRSSEIAKLSF